jgi:hypothetical protein
VEQAFTSTSYVKSERKDVQAMLNDLLNNFFVTGFTTLEEYNSRMKCAGFIAEQLKVGGLDENRFEYTVFTEVDSVETTADAATNTTTTTKTTTTKAHVVRSDSVLYLFTDYSMVEVAPMWWIKCHLLSGLHVSPTETVECDAWDRWLASETPDTLHAIPHVTVKQWLQQTALPTVDLARLLRIHTQDVKEHGSAALTAVHNLLVNANTGSEVHATCNTRRLFNRNLPCSYEEDFEHMVYNTYATGRTLYVNAYSGCCAGLACTVSDTPVKMPSKTQGKSIRSMV